jgi:K+-sensing histidine kinase KdpD
LCSALNSAAEKTAEFAKSRQVTLLTAGVGLGRVLTDENLLIKALHALLETAVKFSDKGATVLISCDVVPNSFRLLVETQGRMIPAPALPKFFDLFSIGEAITSGRDLGLGPPVAYRILALFGASVSVANRDPSGIRLTISLRKAAPNARPITLA